MGSRRKLFARLRGVLYGGCILGVLAACGQRGPLYLPDETVGEIKAEEANAHTLHKNA